MVIPHKVLNILHGQVLYAYMLRSDSKERYCMFGHIYPHMHFIIYNRFQKVYYLVCGATGQFIRLGDSFIDDLYFILSAGILDNGRVADLALMHTDRESIQKLLNQYLNRGGGGGQ